MQTAPITGLITGVAVIAPLVAKLHSRTPALALYAYMLESPDAKYTMFPSPITADVVAPPATKTYFRDGRVVVKPVKGERLVLY